MSLQTGSRCQRLVSFPVSSLPPAWGLRCELLAVPVAIPLLCHHVLLILWYWSPIKYFLCNCVWGRCYMKWKIIGVLELGYQHWGRKEQNSKKIESLLPFHKGMQVASIPWGIFHLFTSRQVPVRLKLALKSLCNQERVGILDPPAPACRVLWS